jgi:hypothetical protein
MMSVAPSAQAGHYNDCYYYAYYPGGSGFASSVSVPTANVPNVYEGWTNMLRNNPGLAGSIGCVGRPNAHLFPDPVVLEP